jgi:argininosuccinate lyase
MLDDQGLGAVSAPMEGTGASIAAGKPVFPAPIYRDTVLAQVFADAKTYFLAPLIEIEYAHTLMLARQDIMPKPEAARCLQALDALDRSALRETRYDGSFEDLFFLLEHKLAEACGAEVAGKMHTARSRNDIDLTMYRMVLRGQLLDLLAAQLTLAKLLAELAWTYRAALMPAYTHNQPAQPTTLGHYLMALVEILERDAERVVAAFTRVNRSPLGACAITTTGFAIDRSLTARLLGFGSLAVNSYGAIAAVDYLLESAAVLTTGMVSLGRFAQDLLLWSTAEFNFLRLSDAYVQISSIMPQKRNPVPLEHVRVLASRALFQAQGVAGCLHNTPFADMNDAEDDLQPLVYTAFADGIRSLTLLGGALAGAEFHTSRMAVAANGNFLTVTELADTLVRICGISFHAAHHLVSTAVKELNIEGAGFDLDRMAAIILRDLQSGPGDPRPITREQILQSLSARNFVDVRSRPGGPALSSLEPEILAAQQQIALHQTWLSATRASLDQAHVELHREARKLIQATGVQAAGVQAQSAGEGDAAKNEVFRP